MPRFNNINGERIQFTQAEETARDLEEAQYAVEQIELAKTQYARDRAEAYPSLADQADMQFHDSVDGTTTWVDAITAVKAEFPKPV
jgi:hypothetical protein